MPALEDKIVQSAVSEVLSAVYEADFLGFSYGFRPGRNPHMALDALHTAIMSQRVNWVLDADIRSFSTRSTTSGCCGWWRTGSLILESYGSSGCGCGLAFLRAARSKRRTGLPARGGHQSAPRQQLPAIPRSLGPPMASSPCTRFVVIVRYADDFVIGFEKNAEADEMLLALKVRLANFGLMLMSTRRG
ncbi:reverse transcriptase/maturase family protein [Mesorhizobium sp.]|uniref:reverse transcriptase/maturase family protein n=1 Tax=Mesorhizobium sp. TaxID=1871066 RepID=UPI0025D2BFFB|nr:reverse transcriptase/maturase family protein [Mesorhizobium sp.]